MLSDAMQHINRLLQAGNYRAAHEQLDIVVEKNPDYAEARRLLAGVKLTLGDAIGAEKILREAAAFDSTWSPTLTTLGELLLGSGRREEAEQFLLKAATSTKADPRAALVLARHCNDSRRHAQALAVVAPFCRSGHLTPELATQHVNALAALGRGDEAIAFYRTLAANPSGNAAAFHALAIALQAANRHDEAERALQPVLTRIRPTAALLHTQARSLVALGEFDRAEAALRAGVSLDPQHVDAHDDLARLVWMRTGDAAQATATMEEALRRFPGNDALRAAKAAVLQGAGDPRAAYACFVPRLEHTQPSPSLLVRAGLAALEFDPATALDLANRALQAKPSDTPARKLMAAARLGVGDARAALPVCETLLVEEPDDQYLIALQTTAWRLLDDERYERFCDYRNLVVPHVLEVPPPWRNLTDFLGDVRRSLEKLHDALRHPLLFQSLRHGTETTQDLTRNQDPVIRALFASFDAPIRDYMARSGKGTDPLQRRNTGAYRFNGSWSVRLRTSGFHHNHVHPRGWISSACYIDLPDNARDPTSREGVLAFAEPGILTTPSLPPQHEVRPEPGTLVLFPSYFWHGTVPFSGSGTRLTVAFDAVPEIPRS